MPFYQMEWHRCIVLFINPNHLMIRYIYQHQVSGHTFCDFPNRIDNYNFQIVIGYALFLFPDYPFRFLLP